MKYKAPRGTRDICLDLVERFDFVEQISKDIFKSFGYEEIRTPIFESNDIFMRSLGETSDIISKEMYTFEDKGGRCLALRPEGTAPLVRAVLENNLVKKDADKRFFYSGPMFRYDRPQSGRYRQFYQIGAEIIGNRNSFMDMEIIVVAMKIMQKIGLKSSDFSLNINSVGCDTCRENYVKILTQYLDNLNADLCENCKLKKSNNILRVFDCKVSECKSILKDAPKILDSVCENCSQDFEMLKKYLDMQNINYIVDKSLVRGLDYYTGMVFEIKTDKLGAQDAIAAGGRYDNLVGEFGSNDIPAVGFALGLDRVVEVLKIENANIQKDKTVFFVTTTKERHGEEILKNFDIITKLREKGFIVRYNSDGKSVKSQMRTANSLNSEYVVFIEEDGKFAIKDMLNGEQSNASKEDIIEILNIKK
jgi:histidyl-tRNA synthetase